MMIYGSSGDMGFIVLGAQLNPTTLQAAVDAGEDVYWDRSGMVGLIPREIVLNMLRLYADRRKCGAHTLTAFVWDQVTIVEHPTKPAVCVRLNP